MTDEVELVGHCVLDEIVTEGFATPEALEAAVYSLTEWLSTLELQPGDELVVFRSTKEAPHGDAPDPTG